MVSGKVQMSIDITHVFIVGVREGKMEREKEKVKHRQRQRSWVD